MGDIHSSVALAALAEPVLPRHGGLNQHALRPVRFIQYEVVGIERTRSGQSIAHIHALVPANAVLAGVQHKVDGQLPRFAARASVQQETAAHLGDLRIANALGTEAPAALRPRFALVMAYKVIHVVLIAAVVRPNHQPSVIGHFHRAVGMVHEISRQFASESTASPLPSLSTGNCIPDPDRKADPGNLYFRKPNAAPAAGSGKQDNAALVPQRQLSGLRCCYF